ncbi:MAG: hypothetical protein QUS33_08350, partial [Dehalococcoidia bacterium]|nr:hypothetical protein [Dehalococcoidia bacterium]
TSGMVPWLYPFKSYDFPTVDWHGILTLRNLAQTMLEMALLVLAVSAAIILIPALRAWVRRRRHPKAGSPIQSEGSKETGP